MKKGIKRIVTAALAAVLMVTQLPAINSKAAAGISIYGKAHVQTYGDTNGKIVKENGIDTLVLGTRGQAKRVESMTINLQNESGYTGTPRISRETEKNTEQLFFPCLSALCYLFLPLVFVIICLLLLIL